MTRNAVAGPLSRAWIGVTFTNPSTGERIEVTDVGRDEDGEVLRGRLTVAPGGSGPPRHVHPRIEELATLFGLAKEGRVGEDGAPRFLQAMVFARAMRDTLYLASPPLPLQRALWTLFSPIGRLRGYRPTYDRFLRPGYWRRSSR